LRYILNAHPDIFCPAETNFGQIASTIHSSFQVFQKNDPAMADLYIPLVQSIADATFGQLTRNHNKTRWCDKSLPTIELAEPLAAVFPNARFICLYRYPTDVMYSLAEACKWGYTNFGVTPYIWPRVGNIALGLMEYWMDKCSRMAEFESRFPHLCHRMRYEDLVMDTEATVKSACEFLGVEWSAECLDPALLFNSAQETGPGDYKIQFTNTVSADSIGRGWQVPLERVPDELRVHANSLLSSLGYLPLDAMELDKRMSGGEVPSAGVKAPSGGSSVSAAVSSASVLSSTQFFEEYLPSRIEGFCTGYVGRCIPPVAEVVVVDARERWIIDLKRRRVLRRTRRQADWRVVTDEKSLLSIANREVNPGVLTSQQALRFVQTPDLDDQECSAQKKMIVDVLSV
jgi:hypothetical protein